MTYRTQFDSELDNLKLNLIKMSDLVIRNITDSLHSFLDMNTELAERIIKDDKLVNDFEYSIEKECMRIILREQPVAKDLRLITSVLKMITDLERIGDHAVDISKLTVFMEKSKEPFKASQTKLMIEVCEDMIRLALDSFVNKDISMAKDVINKDDLVDDYFEEVQHIVSEAIKNNAIDGDYAVYLMMVAKYLERIGDHAVNLAEWVIFQLLASIKIGGNMKPLIFSVEDDLNIQNVIQIALKNSNYEIQLFDNANALFSALEFQKPDLFLLDIMLPDTDGLKILQKLKSNPKFHMIPVMIISAKISEIDRVIGLDSGADDYLIKPFGVLELVSRVKALLRRFKPESSSAIIQIGDLELNSKKYECKYQNTQIVFTKKQFDLLKLLMENYQTIVSRNDILNIVWGFEYIGETRTVDVHIKEIRRKLKDAGIEDTTIETVRGIGYKFVL